MAQVAITLNGRTYRLRCGDGDEQRVFEYADMVRDRLHALADQYEDGENAPLLVVACLQLAAELDDARARLAALELDHIATTERDRR